MYKKLILKKQGCSYILVSKLFVVDYNKYSKTLGILKFNICKYLYEKSFPWVE